MNKYLTKEEILVSIIVPSFNRKKTISQTIDSILKQHRNFKIEIIIGDDCSTDGVRDLLLQYKVKYPEVITLIFHEKNLGIGANWALCVLKSKGKYLANCDDDDFWHNPYKLELQVNYLENNHNIGVIYSDYQTLNRKTNKIIQKIDSNITYKNLQLEIFQGNFSGCSSTMIFRNDILKKFVPLNDYIKYNFPIQDWNTLIVLSAYTEFYCLPVSTVTYCVESESLSRPTSLSKLHLKLIKEKSMYKYLCDMFPGTLHYEESGYDEYINLTLMNFAIKNFDFKNATKFATIISNKSFKIRLISSPLTFYSYCFFRYLKRKLVVFFSRNTF